MPEDADVRVSGIGVMGGFDHGPAVPPVPGGPVIRIKGFAFWGGVGIKRRPPRGARKAGDKHERRRELRDSRDQWRRETRGTRDEWRHDVRQRRDEWRRELRRGSD